jgi:excisionase family DNA binding protein
MAMEFLTPNELSRILKLHPFTITRLAREGKIPGLKVSGVWRFRKDEFERWVVQQGPRKPKRSQRRREPMALAGRS